MRISDCSSDVCSSDLRYRYRRASATCPVLRALLWLREIRATNKLPAGAKQPGAAVASPPARGTGERQLATRAGSCARQPTPRQCVLASLRVRAGPTARLPDRGLLERPLWDRPG